MHTLAVQSVKGVLLSRPTARKSLGVELFTVSGRGNGVCGCVCVCVCLFMSRCVIVLCVFLCVCVCVCVIVLCVSLTLLSSLVSVLWVVLILSQVSFHLSDSCPSSSSL